MPPVALTLASVSAPLSSHPAPTIAQYPAPEAVPVPVAVPDPAPAEPPVLVARPRLRLVSSTALVAEVAEIHGRGGPASCQCRACAMARHPASLPRLTVVR